MHPEWLSNAYLLADEPAGKAVFIDSGAPLEPLHEWSSVSGSGHAPADDALPFGSRRRVTGSWSSATGSRSSRARSRRAASASRPWRLPATPTIISPSSRTTPSRSPQTSLQGRRRRRARRGADPPVGDGRPDDAATRGARAPGHTEETTIGREWEENPFVTYWRGESESIEGGRACRRGGGDTRRLVADYDGKGKAMVRFADGREAIIGGSRVER
jgi:hypothetical protein